MAIDLTEDRLFSLGFGLVFRAVCAPATWDADRVAREATAMDPPGTSANEWVVSDPDDERDDAFKGCNCITCPEDASRRHWLLNC